jgi:hypothetical protein
MRMALSMAVLAETDMDYVNAHGTSTLINDPIETLAIRKAFGEHALKLKVSSTKSMTGHALGVAGGGRPARGPSLGHDQPHLRESDRRIDSLQLRIRT